MHTSRPTGVRLLACTTALAILACLTPTVGCTTGAYRAAELPVNLRATATTNTQRIRLSSFASEGESSSVIGPDDLIAVSIRTGIDTEEAEPQIVQVDASGVADVPVVGPVPLNGLMVAQAGGQIAATAVQRQVFRNPQVTVEMHQQATYRVVVLGAVETPGAYDIPRQACDVVSAIAAAGGLTEEAGPDVELLRHNARSLLADADAAGDQDPGEDAGVQPASFAPDSGAGVTTYRINLAQAGAGASADQKLGERDVVMVHPRDKRVIHVTGLVRKPDQFELPDDQPIRVLDALAMAGGISSPVADKVYVIRPRPEGETGEPAVIEVSVAKAKRSGVENLVLGPGDLISVEQTVLTSAVDVFRDFFRVTVGVTRGLSAF